MRPEQEKSILDINIKYAIVCYYLKLNRYLSEGQMVVITKGVERCPKSVESSYVLLFEPFMLQARGD